MRKHTGDILDMEQVAKSSDRWHCLSVPQIYRELQTNENGLSQSEVERRLRNYGHNRLPEKPPPLWWEILLRQFFSPLIYILLAAAVVSVIIGDVKDAGFIVVVLITNALIGGYQEWKAEQSNLALRRLLQVRASVVRDGQVMDLPAEDLVPGDLVWLESGNRVPADLRLLSSHGLEVDESLLTGESLTVSKDPSWICSFDAPVGDRVNMAYSASTITRGRAHGIVVATGSHSHVGQLALDVSSSAGGKTPLLERMEKLTHLIGVVTLACSLLVGIIGFSQGRYGGVEMFLFVVALAVAAIPEGLPVALTVALAIATTRMARRGVIVRRLTAVEGLGSCTLIATDKTGTLTVNELTVREVRLPNGELFHITGEGFSPNGDVLDADMGAITSVSEHLLKLAKAGVLCNEARLYQRAGHWDHHGDAVDVALLHFAAKLGVLQDEQLAIWPQLDSIPYEPQQQFAASRHQLESGQWIFVKGAPERVLEMCRLDEFSTMEAMALEMGRRGLRVLAVAERPIDVATDALYDLKLLGFVGMIDPVRPEVPEAIRTCHTSGVRVVMITGDHRVTALAIARELDLANEESDVVTGPELTGLNPDEFDVKVRSVRVFARVAPHQKLQIVQSAQRLGHFVAVTGDGVNDAPALRAANIGVAMGRRGTDVAKETAELVISDDNFASIVSGIEEGRVAYDNIRKVVFLLISTGLAELVVMGLAVATGMPLPLLPVQILWLNLVTNGIQDVALVFEPSEGDVLRRAPRPPREAIFNQLMIERSIISSLVMGGIGFIAFSWMLAHGWEVPDARNVLLLMMVLFENFHIGNCRSETKSAFSLSPTRSPILLIGTLSAFLIHVLAMNLPFLQNVLSTSPVSWNVWLATSMLAFLVIPAVELHKLTWFLRQYQRSDRHLRMKLRRHDKLDR